MLKVIGAIVRGLYRLLKGAAVLVFGLLAFAILFAVLRSVNTGPDGLIIQDDTVLEVAIEGFVVEEAQSISPLALAGVTGSIEPETPLRIILLALNVACYDDSISGVILKLDRMFGASPAALTEIGMALERIRAVGKPIVAHGDFYLQSHYYLASFADDILLNTAGFVTVSGYGIYPLYFKEALDEYNVTINAFRAGTYKSFVEPYTRADMSEEAKAANRAFLGSLWNHYLDTVSANRADQASVTRYVQNPLEGLTGAGGNSARWAYESGLVTSLAPRDGIRAALRTRFGGKPNSPVETVSFYDYAAQFEQDYAAGADTVAVLYAVGEILDGEQPAGAIGGDTLAKRIRQAANKDSIKAIVLRIDSPGGSAFASEVIRQELLAAKAKGKTIVASMGGAAASGGYWIATAADRILAQPTTITGSIGVFLVAPTFEQTLKDFGVQSDGVSTAPLADAFSATRGISPLGKSLLQAQVEDAYGQFLQLVADARNMTTEEVDSVAQGRVWTGAQAKDLGLVDEFGDLDDAIIVAAELAGLDEYNEIIVTDPPTPLEQLMMRLEPYMGASTARPETALTPSPAALKAHLAEAAIVRLDKLGLGTVQARCLDCMALTTAGH